jgi:hypothetical protein
MFSESTAVVGLDLATMPGSEFSVMDSVMPPTAILCLALAEQILTSCRASRLAIFTALSDFSTMAVLALTSTDAELRGSFCSISGATYGYLVPFYNGADHRKEPRSHVQRVYDICWVSSRHNARLEVFSGGFSDASYDYAHVGGANSDKLPRVLPSDFTTLGDFSTMAVLALTTTDAELGGSFCRISGSAYGYLVPFYNGAYHEKGAAVSHLASLRHLLC